MGKRREAGSFKLQTEGAQGQGFFYGLFASFLMMLTTGAGMGSMEKWKAIVYKAG